MVSCIADLGLRGLGFDSRGVLNTKRQANLRLKLHIFFVDEFNIYFSTDNLINRISKINNFRLNYKTQFVMQCFGFSIIKYLFNN